MTDRALDRAALSPTQFSAELVIVHVLGNVSRWTFRIWMHPCLPGRPKSKWTPRITSRFRAGFDSMAVLICMEMVDAGTGRFLGH